MRRIPSIYVLFHSMAKSKSWLYTRSVRSLSIMEIDGSEHPSRDDNDLDFFSFFGGFSSPRDMLFCSSLFLRCTISMPVPVSGAAFLVGHGGGIFYSRN